MRPFVCLGLAFLLATTVAAQLPEPSAGHAYIQQDAGTWKGVMTMKMPNSPEPINMDCQETSQLLPGGLWLLTEFESGPFHGRSQIGYDPKTKKCVGTWIDNANTFVTVMTGDYDAEQGELVMTFRGRNQFTGEDQEMKSVSTREGKDKRRFVTYEKRGGEWVKSFEINYERVK